MADLASVRRRFRYHRWAMQTLVEAVRLTPVPEALRPLAHTLVADRVWLLRLRGDPTEGLVLWPDLDADGCHALARRNADAYDVFLAEAGLDGAITYRNSTGTTHETAVRDVLDHVLLHAAHHRGQVNAALRAAGTEPPWVDYLAWLRAGEPS